MPAQSATVGGAIKVLLENQSPSLGISVYRDRAPKNQAPPYVTVNDLLAVVPDGLEDGVAGTVRETVTVDLWMNWKNVSSGASAESYTLPGAIFRAMHGARLSTSPTLVYALLVEQGPRLVDEEENNVLVPFTVRVLRVA